MYGFWSDYVKSKYNVKSKLCYMDTNSFIVYIKTDDINKDIAEDVWTWFDTSNYKLDRPFPKEKNKKLIRLMKDELGGEMMIKFVGLWAETYSYSIEDGSEDRKAKGTKNCVVNRKLKFENYENSLKATQLNNKMKIYKKWN